MAAINLSSSSTNLMQCLERPTKPQSAIWTLPFLLLVGVQFSFGTSFSTFFALPKYLLEALGADAALVGNANGAFALGGVLAIFLWGPLLDRWGRFPVLVTGLSLAALTYAPFGYFESVPAIILLRLVHGVAFAAVFNAGSALAVDMAPSQRRAEALGYFATAMLVTNAVGPTMAETVAGLWGWRAVFWGCTACALVGLLAASRLKNAATASYTSASDNTAGTRSALSLPLIGAYAGAAAMGVGTGTSKTFLPAILVDAGQSLAPYFLAYTAGAVFQRTVLGWLPDRFGRGWAWKDSRLVRMPGAIAGLFAYALALFTLSSYAETAALWLAPFVGMAHGMAYPAVSALGVDLGGASLRGRVTTWMTGAFNLGFALSTAGLAPLEPQLGYGGLLGCGAAYLLLSSVALPLIVLAGLRPRGPGPIRRTV